MHFFLALPCLITKGYPASPAYNWTSTRWLLVSNQKFPANAECFGQFFHLWCPDGPMLDHFHHIIATQTNKKWETWKLSVKHCLYDAILEIRFIFLAGLLESGTGTSVASDANPESSQPCSCSLPPTSSHFTPTISKHCRLYMLKPILTNCFKQFHYTNPP